MTMRYLFVAAAISLSLISHADIIEDKEPGILEVHYVKTTVSDTIKWKSHSDHMTLRIGRTAAMFYPTERMWADSLRRTNFELHEKIYRELNPIGKPGYVPIGGLEREYLFRNMTEGETMVYRTIAGDPCSYVEPTECPVWEIGQETKEILGYQCRRATCGFRGRVWVVWFTPEIPVSEGPWKLFGLPGLVLEAEDCRGHYSYRATGISSQDIRPVGIRIYNVHDPFRIKSRQRFLQRLYKQYIKGYFVARMSSTFGNGSQSEPIESQYDFQETDYPHE